MSGGGGGTQTVYTNNNPWEPAQSYLNAALYRGRDLYRRGQLAPQMYQGPTVANQSGATTAGQQSIMREAAGGTPGLDQAQFSLNRLMQGEGPGSSLRGPNAGLTAIAQGSPLLRQMSQSDPRLAAMGSGDNIYRDLDAVKAEALGSAIPAASAMFTNSGMLDSTTAQDAVGRAATQAVAPIEYGAWDAAQNRALSAIGQDANTRLAAQGQNVQQQLAALGQNDARQLQAAGLTQQGVLQAAGMQPDLMKAGYLPGIMQGMVGGQQDARSQQALQGRIDQFNQNAMRPANNYQSYLDAIMGIGGLGGSGAQTGPAQGPSQGQQMLGSAMGGLGTAGSLMAMGMGGPLAWGAGGLAALMGMMG